MSYLLQTQFNLSTDPNMVSDGPNFLVEWLQQGHTADSIKSFNEQDEFLRALESPCDDIPVLGLGFQYFYTLNPSYDSIHCLLESTLSSQKPHRLSYNDSLKEFVVTQLLPSGFMRQDTVAVFWDRCRKDHVIEVRKTAGDAIFLSEAEKFNYVNVYLIIHLAFTGSTPISVRERVLTTIGQDIRVNNLSCSPTGVSNLAFSPTMVKLIQR